MSVWGLKAQRLALNSGGATYGIISDTMLEARNTSERKTSRSRAGHQYPSSSKDKIFHDNHSAGPKGTKAKNK
jgi:hypothetical protein